MRYEVFASGVCPLLHIRCIGYAADPYATRFGPGQRDVYIIHYVLSGQGIFNGTVVKAGQGFLITPGMEQTYHADPADPWSFLWFISDDRRMGDLYPCFCPTADTHVFTFPCLKEAVALADWLVTRPAVSDPFALTDRFLDLFRLHRRPLPKEPSVSNATIYLRAATDYIHTNLCHPLPVAELTAFLGVSQPYLYTLFRDAFGCSPKQYILDEKLALARRLLTDTALPITRVATSVGFADGLAFSKFFTARMGVSPRSYRDTEGKK